MADENWMSSYQAGANTKMDMVNKAVDLEKKQYDIAQQREQVAVQKLDMMKAEFDKLGMLPQKMRQQRIDMYSKQMANAAGVNVDPGTWEMMANDHYRVPIADALSAMSEEDDPKKRAALANMAVGAFSDPQQMLSGATQWAAELRQRRLIASENAKGQGKSPGEQEDALRREYSALKPVQTMEIIKDSYQKGILSAKEKSAAGDMALIYGLMKSLDPATGVKEGEYAAAEKTRGLPASMVALYNKAIDGDKLTPKQRTDFVKQMQNAYSVHNDNLARVNKQFQKIAKERKLDVTNITMLQSIEDDTRQRLKDKNNWTDAQLDQYLSNYAKKKQAPVPPAKPAVTQQPSKGAVNGKPTK
jgi:hypothetical protein